MYYPSVARRYRHSESTWPGFVDALSALLIVLVFMLLIFTVAQVYLAQQVTSKEDALDLLSAQIEQLADQLALERKAVTTLTTERDRLKSSLEATLSERDTLASTAEAAGQRARVASTALAASEEARIDQAERIATLGQQIEALRRQLSALEEVLAASESTVAAQTLEIEDLGKRLNVALAKRSQELERYRSEFFGRLREVLGERADVRIVGDRFVFESSVLFATGSARLGEAGQAQIRQLAETLQEISARIPDNVSWLLRVDGHTDQRPIHNERFESNWELSTERAISVVRHLIDSGIPPNRLAATGFGEHQPIAEGTSPEALRQNPRIEFRLTDR